MFLNENGDLRGGDETTRVDDMFEGIDMWPRVPETI